MKDFSAFLHMRKYKNWAHKISSLKYLTVWRPVWPVHRLPPIPVPARIASLLIPTRNSFHGVLKVSNSTWFNPCRGVCVLIFSLLEKAMALHSSTLAWKIPWTEKPGRLQSMGLRRVGHDWEPSLSLFTFMHWRRKWQPTPVFLPGESQGWEPGGLPSMGPHRVGHDWSDLAA